MCRIFYMLNRTNTKSKINKFLMQSEIEPVAKDGHGLAALNSITHKWRVYKSSMKESNRSEIMHLFSEYSLVIGHIRRTMLPLMREYGVKIENTHPFYYRNHVFLHNGMFENANSYAHRKWFKANILPDLWTQIKGDTDSEHVFYLLLSIIQNQNQNQKLEHEELNNAVQICFRLLYNAFDKFFANFIYANKDYSVVGRIEKNATIENKRNATLYMSKEKNKILFSTLPLNNKQTLVEWGVIYVIHNHSAELHKYEIRFT